VLVWLSGLAVGKGGWGKGNRIFGVVRIMNASFPGFLFLPLLGLGLAREMDSKNGQTDRQIDRKKDRQTDKAK
jgi:hypothetical protein